MTVLIGNIKECVKLEKITDINCKIVSKATVPDVENIKHTLKGKGSLVPQKTKYLKIP